MAYISTTPIVDTDSLLLTEPCEEPLITTDMSEESASNSTKTAEAEKLALETEDDKIPQKRSTAIVTVKSTNHDGLTAPDRDTSKRAYTVYRGRQSPLQMPAYSGVSFRH